MHIITGDRASGKTTKLIKMSAKNGIYILVANRTRALYLSDLARKLGYYIPFPVTLEEYYKSHGFAGSCIKRDGLYIDDADEILQNILKDIEIKAMTLITDKGE